MGPATFVRALGQPAALCGLGAGFLFAVTALAIRDATGSLPTDDLVLAALLALVCTMAIQTTLQGGYILVREREQEQVRRIIGSWRLSGLVGLLAAFGSACWFTGFATAPVALVRIIGQVEIVFILGFSRFYLGDRWHDRGGRALPGRSRRDPGASGGPCVTGASIS